MLSSGSPFSAQQHRVRVKGNVRREPECCPLAVHSLHNSTESESKGTSEGNHNVVSGNPFTVFSAGRVTVEGNDGKEPDNFVSGSPLTVTIV